MKQILIIAYYFPPSGGPGVQRVLKHIQYLPEFGWQPVVLTVENGNFPARDESLLNKIPDEVIVYRTKIIEPYSLYRILTGKKKDTPIDVNVIKKESQRIPTKEKIAEYFRGTFFIPDARVCWLLTVKSKIKKILKKHNIEAIYSSSPPYTCSLIARGIKRKTGLPWIAGFRDPWTEFLTTPKRWFLPSAIDKCLERSVFVEADAIECAWVGIKKDAIRKYPDLPENKFHHIPNGFDSNDFPVIEIEKNTTSTVKISNVHKSHNNKFTVTYTGSMYGRRNPASFLKAIENLIHNGKINIYDFRLRFIGRFGAEVLEMFDKASFKNSIEIIQYIPHEESIKQLLISDALLLIVDEAKESEEIVPGKVYEYIGTRKPIIAIAPENSAIAHLIAETKTGLTAHQSEIEKIGQIFLDYYNQWKTGNWSLQPDNKEIIKYERRESAKHLAKLLNNITELSCKY